MQDTTIDPREVAHYENLAAFWWDEKGPFWPLHRLNELRVDWICERLCIHFAMPGEAPAPLSGLRVLDIGCGGGILAESMARLGADVTGIDVVEKNVRIASAHARKSRLPVQYQHSTAAELADTGRRFDAVLNMEVVEHVADLPAFMESCNRLVAPGGLQFIATINRTWLAWLFAIVGAEYVLGWLPRGTHRWREFRKPVEVEASLIEGGLSVRERAGVRVNPLTGSFGLTGTLSVNYMLMAALGDWRSVGTAGRERS